MVIEDTAPWSSGRARSSRRGERRILGIAGPPGGGKSTVARAVVAELGELARLVPMDGFHLAQAELVRLGRRDRMGAPDTFDAAGYAALLERLRGDEPVVYAPEFRREIEEPIAGAIAVPRATPLVVTEGNYLLLGDGDWALVRPLLDEAWYVETDEELRRPAADPAPHPVRQDARVRARVGACAATSATPRWSRRRRRAADVLVRPIA